MNKKIFTKAISLILSVVLALSTVAVAFAVPTSKTSKYPIIYFRGNSERIYDEDGNQVYDFDVDGETIKAITKRVLPLLGKGILTNDFEEYYDAIEEEFVALYDRVMLDGDGNPRYGTGISENEKRNNEREMNTNYSWNGQYNINYYDFANDWRLDPLTTIEEAKVYIDNVLRVTGAKKVCLACKCLGGDMILAYLAKYGTENIHAVCFGSTVAFGSELVSDTFSGNIDLHPEDINRFVNDRYMTENVFGNEEKLIYDVIKSSLDLATAIGLTGTITGDFMNNLYSKLYNELVPRITTATYGTWPGYWTMVTADNYEYTRDFVFGEEGSEKRVKYAGLIEKLDNYDRLVRQRIPELLKQAEADGVSIGIVSKYGSQMPPVTTTSDEQGDVWVSSKLSSLGGTLSKVGTTLSEDYITSRVELGYGKYISPDKQVDASTCLFPEYTWFLKGAVHDDWTKEEDYILISICDNDQRITINDLDDRPQFLVYDKKTDTVSPMTKDNCHTETYEVDGTNSTASILQKLFRWLKVMLEFIKTLFNKEEAQPAA